jgi:hypothetical protein
MKTSGRGEEINTHVFDPVPERLSRNKTTFKSHPCWKELFKWMTLAQKDDL